MTRSDTTDSAPVEFAPPPASALTPSDDAATARLPTASHIAHVDTPPEPQPPEAAAQPTVSAVDTADAPRSRSLAEALEGIAMPCDLAPLIGNGEMRPYEVAFFTDGYEPATVGAALSDELERLGFEITPVDDRSIRAVRGADMIRAKLTSAALTSADVMKELHPSAPSGALVVELNLT